LIIVQSSDHISGIIAEIVSDDSGSDNTGESAETSNTEDKPKEEEIL